MSASRTVGRSRVEELVLQGLGAGGNDHLAAREQRRHQVGEGLAGAGAGLGDQHAIAGDGRRDALRHLELLRSQAKAGHGGGERPLGGKDAFEIGHGGRGMVARSGQHSGMGKSRPRAIAPK